MKTKIYLLLMLGMIFLFSCSDNDSYEAGLGISNVILPNVTEESRGTEITIKGNGFSDDDVLALSSVSSGTEKSLFLETRAVTDSTITVLYPITATKDYYGVVLVRKNRMRRLGIIYSVLGKMPDENLRNAISELYPNLFVGDRILGSAKEISFKDGALDISGKKISSLDGLEYFPTITNLNCSDNNISEIPKAILSKLVNLTAENTGLKTLVLGTKDAPNQSMVSLNVDGNTNLTDIDLYYTYAITQFSAQNCGLVNLDVRNYHSIYGGCLNYNGNDFKFTFTDNTDKTRTLKLESWWMDSYYAHSGSVVDALNKGVTVECYDWLHNYGGHYYSNGNYQKTMTKYAEIPDANLRNALKSLVPDVFNGDNVITQAALVSQTLKKLGTLDLSNKGIKSLEGLQYFCGYKTLILDGNNLGNVELSRYVISTSYTESDVDEKGVQHVSAKNAGLTKFVAGDQYTLYTLDLSNNSDLTYIDISRCRGLTDFNALGCNLEYLDLRELADQYTRLTCDANRVKFTFASDTSKSRKLLGEEWWIDGNWSGENPCMTAKNKGVRIDCYDYLDTNKNVITKSYN